MTTFRPKHESPLPSPRTIRRACANELYRTVKRLGIYVAPARLKEAETLYAKKVIARLPWIHENHSNRKRLADWWEETVCADIARLWEVDANRLARAFREAFGG